MNAWLTFCFVDRIGNRYELAGSRAEFVKGFRHRPLIVSSRKLGLGSSSFEINLKENMKEAWLNSLRIGYVPEVIWKSS